MNVSWKNVDIYVPNKNIEEFGKYSHIIHDSSGCARKGKVLAIMGPSAREKTTFLKALVGRVPPGSRTSGIILGDGNERNIKDWVKRCAYVGWKSSTVYENLTLYETVLYAAKFRCPDQNDIKSKVDKILKELDIDKIAHTKMDSISRGERKRAMTAVELVSDPDIIVLNDPTYKLNPYLTISFVKLLKEYAVNNNKTIIFSIHQPPKEAFQQFDDLLLLSQGRTMYCGKADECESFFKSHNFTRKEGLPFSDYALEFIIKENVGSPACQNIIKLMKSKHGGNEAIAFKKKKSNDVYVDYSINMRDVMILLERRFRTYKFTWKKLFGIFWRLFIITCIVIIFKSILTTLFENAGLEKATCYIACFPIVAAYSSFFVVHNCFYSIFAFAPEIGDVKRELGVCTYSTTSYYLSVYVFEALEQLPFNIIHAVALYYFVNLGFFLADVLFLSFIGIFLLPMFLCLGALTKNYESLKIMTVIAAILHFQSAKFNASKNGDFNIFMSQNLIFMIKWWLSSFWVPSYFIYIFNYLKTKYLIPKFIMNNFGVNLMDSKDYNRLFVEEHLTFMPYVKPRFYYLLLAAIVSFIGCIALSIFLLGRLLKPSFRMKMS